MGNENTVLTHGKIGRRKVFAEIYHLKPCELGNILGNLFPIVIHNSKTGSSIPYLNT